MTNEFDFLATFFLGLVALFTITMVKDKKMMRKFWRFVFCISIFVVACYAIIRSLETVLLMTWTVLKPIMQPHLLQIFALIAGLGILFIFAVRIGIFRRKKEAAS